MHQKISNLLFTAAVMDCRRILTFIICIGILSCGDNAPQNLNTDETIASAAKDTLIINYNSKPAVGEEIDGDFNGDGKIDFATAMKVKEGEGNPAEFGIADEYTIKFLSTNLKEMPVGCCAVRLVNEGDLTGDGADEMSVFQAPSNGCTYSMTTYSFVNGKWHELVKLFPVPTGCEPVSNKALQERVFKDGDSIYYLAADVNNEHGKLIRKNAFSSFNPASLNPALPARSFQCRICAFA